MLMNCSFRVPDPAASAPDGAATGTSSSSGSSARTCHDAGREFETQYDGCSSGSVNHYFAPLACGGSELHIVSVKQQPSTVTVDFVREAKDIVLVLSSAMPVEWRLSASSQAHVTQVIVLGTGSHVDTSRVEYVIPVVYSGGSVCRTDALRSDPCVSYLEGTLGRTVTSFRGCDAGYVFVL